MIGPTSFLVILGVLAVFVIVCLMCICYLWKIDPALAESEESKGHWGLVQAVKNLREATKEGEYAMDPEDALLLVIRTRAWLTAGFFAFASLALICGTVITCLALRRP